jgi:parallel beta-helix repeat protein
VAENGSGLYFCWHNRGHLLRHNKFVRNRGGGITGLGDPLDHNNTIEHNHIAENGAEGIEINGGGDSGNVIRDNTIENNSQAEPGTHPGIALAARRGDARRYTITGNTIRDTQPTPTQHVGIEESYRVSSRTDQPFEVDANVIRENTFSGHPRADVILVGPNSTASDNGQAKVVRKQP